MGFFLFLELCLIGKRMENVVCFGCACAGRPRFDRRKRKHLMHSHDRIRSSSQRLIIISLILLNDSQIKKNKTSNFHSASIRNIVNPLSVHPAFSIPYGK